MTWLLLFLFLAAAIPIGIVSFAIIATESEQPASLLVDHQPFRTMKKVIGWFCWGYTALLVCGSLVGLVIGLTTTYGDLSGVGCNFYDALLYGIDCRGFVGARVLELIASFSLLLVQISAIAITSPIMLGLAIPLWLPVFVALFFATKRLTHHSTGSAANNAAGR